MDAANGGYFDLVVRARGTGAFRLLSADRVVATAMLKNGEATIPNVYLNPGADSLMVFVDRAGFALDALEFRRATRPPATVEAEWATRTGQVVTTKDGLANAGQLAGTIAFGVHATQAGPNTLRFHYANGSKDLTFRLSVNDGGPVDVRFPHTDGARNLDVPLTLLAGANKIELAWKTQTYDSLQIDRMEVVRP